MKHQRWFIFGALACAYLFVYFHRLSLTVVAEELARAFQTSAGSLGLLGSVYFYCYAFMQFPAGLLSDSLGPRKTVAFFTVLAALGSAVFGLAPSLSWAFAGRFLVGIGAAMVFIPTMKILAQWFRPTEFASVSGLLNAVGGLGILAATWLLAYLAGVLGWRTSFQLIGGLTAAISLMVWLVVRDRPAEEATRRAAGPSHPLSAGAAANPGASALFQGLGRVLRSGQFWVFALWCFFNYGIFFGFGGLWSGPYLMHVYGMSREKAGAVLSLIAWGMIVGGPLMGIVSDRVLKSRKKLLVGCAVTMTGELGFLYAFPSGLPVGLLTAFFFLFSISSSSVVVVAFTAAKELCPADIAGTCLGTLNLFPFLGGAAAMPLLGRLLDAYGATPGVGYPVEAYSAMLCALLAASAATTACTVFMKETYPG